MMQFSVYCLVFLAVFNVLINGAVVVNRSEKDLFLRRSKTHVAVSSTDKPKSEVPPKAKPSRRQRCCNLGKDVAKIGEACTYTSNIDRINPNEHYHQMKTAIWMSPTPHPINRRLLAKCKPYKVFYEKCCRYEYSSIEDELVKTRKKLTKYLREVRKNEVKEDQGSAVNNEGGLPVEQDISHNRHRIVVRSP